jgi:hypothetical protein
MFHLLTTDMKEQNIKGAINTVNVQAFLTRRNAQENIRSKFTTRNTFTQRSVLVDQMPQGRYALSAIQATVGILVKAEYMERQESGGIHKGKAGKNLSIPTDAARGGVKSAPVQRPVYLSRIKNKIVRSRGFLTDGTHKARMVALAADAFQRQGYIFLTKKLFRVQNFVNRGENVSFRLRQVYGFDKSTTRTPATPWMRPAQEKVARDTENIFISQMKKLGR